jgi:hypothetical protein
VLRDADGKPRAVLTMTDTNSAALGFFDRDGNERTSLFTDPKGESALVLYDETSKARVMLGFGFGEQGALVIAGPNGEIAAGLLVDKDGVPIFEAGQGN